MILFLFSEIQAHYLRYLTFETFPDEAIGLCHHRPEEDAHFGLQFRATGAFPA